MISHQRGRHCLKLSYILWIGAEERPGDLISRNQAFHVARTTRQANKLIKSLGLPLIVSFGQGSINFARSLRRQELPDGFTYRIHNTSIRDQITRIMK